jgi:hypothetical protein
MPTVSEGTLYRRNGSERWYIKFYLDGEPRRESAGTTDREAALEFLKRRLAEARRGLFMEIEQRPKFEELRALLIENYRFKRNRTDPNRDVDRLADFSPFVDDGSQSHPRGSSAGDRNEDHRAQD